MVIGIDSSRAFVSDKTGTENYSYYLITHILRLPESCAHTFVLFTRPNAILPTEINRYTNVIVKEVKWPYLWTQLGLAWETWKSPHLDVLWIPAHTLPVLRKPGITTVVTIHGLEYQWLPEYKNWLQKWYLPLSTFYAAKAADRLIAVSKFSAKQLEKELHTRSEKINVIHEGVEASTSTNQQTNAKIDSVMDKYGIKWKRYGLFVGSVQPRKNLVSLIAAFAHTDLEKLVIAGSIGWMAEGVLCAPSKYNVGERVVFTGRISDLELANLYLGALMYIQPSVTEGFGLPVLEAMDSHVPVISSDGGALREVVDSAGMIVQLSDNFESKLARAIKQLMNDKKLQNKLIAMGHMRIKEFGWDKAAKATLSVLVG